MNQFKKAYLFLVLSLSFFIQSCDNEIIDPAIVIPDPIESGSLQVNFDGQIFESTATTATKTIGTASVATYKITGTLTGTTTKAVTILFTENGTNTFLTGGIPYSQGGGGSVSYMENTATPTSMFTSINYANATLGTGQINVTSINTTNKLISGTFNCTVYMLDPVTGTVNSSKVFSNGIFNKVSYTE